MGRARWLICLLVCLVVAGCGGGGRQRAPSASDVSARVDPAVARALQRTLDRERRFDGLPGVAAAVLIPGKGLWSGGSGVADRATAAPVTASTPFAIASLTKTFIAALAVKLAEQGRFGLDDPISRWLPRWPNAQRITVRELLNQTSGVSPFDERLSDPINRAIDARPRSFWSAERTLSYAGKPASAPGAQWQYNNANYLLAGQIIEHATHATVAQELRREFLDPLHLSDIVLQPQEHERLPAAHGYGMIDGDKHARDLADGSRFVPYTSVASSAWTAGGMVASAPSVARLADALLRGSLLTPASRKQMFTTVPANGTGYFSYGLGIGQTFSTRLFKNVWTTYGLFPGFGSTLRYLPGRNVTVVVLANGDNATPFTADIADLLLQTATEPAGSG
jgi:D-alanyl-D-alanine carboxypeptidase